MSLNFDSNPNPPREGFREISLAECDGLSGVVPDRAERLPRFIGLATSASERLESLGVALVGVGSVGGIAAGHLARLQIRRLQLVDAAAFKPASLLTHAIPPSAVGQWKVDYSGRWSKAASPRTRVEVFRGRVQSLPPDAFADVDVVVMATDNLAAEVEVGRRCIALGKELHQAAVHGETLVARNSVWKNRGGAGPCPACGFGELEWLLAARQARFICSGPDGQPAEEAGEIVPTTSVSVLCAMAAEFTVINILRSVLELGLPLTDSVQEYCGYTGRTTVSRLSRKADCPLDHTAWTLATAARPLVACSPHELAECAGLGGAGAANDLSFDIDDFSFVESSTCCGAARHVRRFVRDGEPVGRCNACGRQMSASEFFTHRPVPASVLDGSMHRPLGELGADSARCVVVRGGGRTVAVRDAGTAGGTT